MKRLIYLLPFLFLMVSCLIDDRSNRFQIENDENEVTLSFSVNVPGQNIPNLTRAMSEEDEKHVRSITLLGFIITDNGKELLDYIISPKTWEIDSDGKLQFTTKVYKNNNTYRYVVVANCEDEIAALGRYPEGDNKEKIISKLIYKNNKSWKANHPDYPNEGFTSIPMWGETEPFVAKDADNEISVKLLRMLARVDVSLNTEEAKEKFKLTSVRVYNRKTKGYIIPNSDFIGLDGQVTKPTVPADDDPDNFPLNIEYPAENEYFVSNDDNTSIIREVYIFEAEAGTVLSNATCVVIGGYYGDDQVETYYRLDFFEKDESGNDVFRNILRNHRYFMKINSVSGSGEDTPDHAYESRPANLEVEILEWDEYDMNVDIVGADFFLSVNKSFFKFTKEELLSWSKENTLKIYTDYSDGWEITSIADAETGDEIDWLYTESDKMKGEPGDIHKLPLYLKENQGVETRTAKITITAGRLNHKITVKQTTDGTIGEDPWLTLLDESGNEIEELIFPSGLYEFNPIVKTSFSVNWGPVSEDVSVAVSPIENTFEYGPGSNVIINATLGGTTYNGQYVYPIDAKEMDASDFLDTDFPEKSTLADFSVGTGNLAVIKSMRLRQIHYALKVSELPDKYYTDGSEYKFLVTSNTNWVASIVSDDNGILEAMSLDPRQFGKKHEMTQTYFRFNTTDTGAKGTAIIRFTNPDNKFAPVDVEITSDGGGGGVTPDGLANCYIVKPGGYGVEFGIADQVNPGWKGITGKQPIGENDELEVELLWADGRPAFGTSTSLISSLEVKGTGTKASIVVMSGTTGMEGNAVIVVKPKTGTYKNKVIWSWHIWVTDYDPDSNTATYYDSLNNNKGYTFMDRFLGATSNEEGNPAAYGLFYQWGRKDPFPGADVVSGVGYVDPTALYNASNSRFAITNERVSVSNNFTNSVHNPATFYFQKIQNGWTDWYTTSPESASSRNDKLWWDESMIPTTGSGKTYYDPCPSGWHVSNWSFETWRQFRDNSAWEINGRLSDNTFVPGPGYVYGSHGGDENTEFLTKNIGRVHQPGKWGMMWSGRVRPDNNYPDNFHIYYDENISTIVDPTGGRRRSDAHSIRCVKIEQ